MADKTSKAFAKDALKKTGTWAGVSVAVLAGLIAFTEEVGQEHLWDTHGLVALAIPALRGILALWQGNIGDRSKASFAPAPGADPED